MAGGKRYFAEDIQGYNIGMYEPGSERESPHVHVWNPNNNNAKVATYFVENYDHGYREKFNSLPKKEKNAIETYISKNAAAIYKWYNEQTGYLE